jgi:hypothetical protein
MPSGRLDLDKDYALLTGNFKVRINFTAMSRAELEHLQSGVFSELERREQGDTYERNWSVPGGVAEVFIPAKTKEVSDARRVVCLERIRLVRDPG